MKKRSLPWLMLAATPLLLGLCLLVGVSKIGIPNSVILQLRINRVLAGFIVGASLASAGAVFQAILRNPLAEPYLLGVSSGAGVGAALAILLGWTSISIFALPLSAFVLACLTLFIVYRLASVGGRTSIYGLILSGVIVSSICSSILLFLISRASREGLHGVMWWMLGNLVVHSKPLLFVSGLFMSAGILAIWAAAPELNALTLGQDIAHHVGVRTRVAVTLGLCLATLVSAAAVSLSGLIGFVGLIVPHVVRTIVGPDHRRLIPACALTGGVFLALCDAIARAVLEPPELRVGVITALIGGPFFLMILRGRRKKGWVE